MDRVLAALSLVFPLLLALSVPADSVLALGGQEVRIADLDVDLPDPSPDVAVTEDGVLFASCVSDADRTFLNVYRSDDGGTTWSLWTQLGSQYAVGEVYQARMVATSGSPGRILVGWIDRQVPSGSAMRVSSFDVGAAVPVWTHAEVETDGAYGITKPRISVREGVGGLQRVCVAWHLGFGGVQVATSGDGGVSWSTPVEAYGFNDIVELEIVADDFGVVHLAWINNNFNGDSNVQYGRATSNGVLASHWAPVATIITVADQTFSRMTLTADPDGDGVVAAVSGASGLELVSSVDDGLSWGSPQYHDDLLGADGAWGALGPRIAVRSLDPVLGSGWAVLRPVFGITGTWSVELMAPKLGGGPIVFQLAVDPSRGGRPALVTIEDAPSPPGTSGSYDLWFDAAWRDAPGYGVPDPIAPITTDSGPITRAVLPADLDGDGTAEIVFSEATSDTAHTLRWRTPGADVDLFSTDDLHPDAGVALLDVDGDGDREVVALRPDGTLVIRQGDGSVVAGTPLDLGLGSAGGWISGARVVGAVEEDVVVAGGNTVTVLGPGGVARPGFPFVAPGAAGQANGRVALGDLDGDGTVELVAPFTGGLVVLDRDGAVVSVLGQGQPSPGSPSLADLDDDGDLEIAIARADGSVHLVRFDGTSAGAAWPYDTGEVGAPSQIALADLAGDDHRELVFMAADGSVHAVSVSGSVLAGWPVAADPATTGLDPIVATLGPAGSAVAFGDAAGTMRVRTGGGDQEGWPRDLASAVHAPATAADLDDDGQVELIVPTADWLWILDMGVAPSTPAIDWPVSGADVGRTGRIGEPAVSTAVDTAVSPRSRLSVAPNPFNPRTVVRFGLAVGEDAVALRLFDAKGRLVRTLHDGPLGAGEHAFTWDGRADDGRDVASGVYFCRLMTGDVREGRSIVLVR